MTIKSEYRTDGNYFYTLFIDVVNSQAIKEHIMHIIEQSKDKDARGDFIDLSNITKIDISTYDIYLTSDMSKPVMNYSPYFKLAIYAPTSYNYGIARQFQSFYEAHETITVRVFKTAEEGIRWLTQDNNEQVL